MNASIKAVIKKNILANGNYPIYLRVTLNRSSKFYKTPYQTKLKEWNQQVGEFNAKCPNYLQRNRVLDKIKISASNCLDELCEKKKNFDINFFDESYRDVLNPVSKNFLSFFKKIASDFRTTGKVSTARSLEITVTSLEKFDKNLSAKNFSDICFAFLNDYELFLRTTGCNNGGIGVYMRNIRLVLNQAIKRKLCRLEEYPFRDYKISKLKSKPRKTSLTKEEFEKIVDFDLTENYGLTNAKYTFIFSVLCRGMNFTDIAELKWEHIRNNRFEYRRNKTGIPLSVKISDSKIMAEILDYYRWYSKETSEYIFPILKKDIEDYDPEELRKRKDSVRVYLNKQLLKLLKKCSIEKNITFYSGRHTFATISLKSGISTEIISQALGHQDLKTTKAYLEDFTDDELDSAFDNVF